MNNQVIVGTLHPTRNGYWFELADERAGVEANTFDSAELAHAALDELDWDCDIYALDSIREMCPAIF